MTKRITRYVISIWLLAVFFAGRCYGAGFALLEQSAEGTGFAYAGATAGYDDGSAIFFNPGALSASNKTILSIGGSFIGPNATFHNEGSHMIPALGGTPLTGSEGVNGGVDAWLPNLYVVHPISNELTAGFGLNSPFGLSTVYSDDWIGRYSSIKTELRTISISPALSYKPIENFSIGAALNIMYAGAELSNAVDFGTIGLSKLGTSTAAHLGLLPQMADGIVRVNGHDWGVGATAGAAFMYGQGSRIGMTYRSQVNFGIRGDADFDVPTNAKVLTSTGLFTNTSGKANLTIPNSLAVGWIHRFDDQWAILGDAQWTRWSHFKELKVSFSNAQPDSVVDESWNNVWRFSVGAEYRPIKPLRLRTGFSCDKEPIADKYHRTPRIPGNDRYWIAAGASYDLTDLLRLDASYAHLFVPDSKTDIISSTGNELIGRWNTGIDIISAQLVYMF